MKQTLKTVFGLALIAAGVIGILEIYIPEGSVVKTAVSSGFGGIALR